jgi:hypothetical protein
MSEEKNGEARSIKSGFDLAYNRSVAADEKIDCHQ